jgi:hypothetical protein
LEGIASIVLGGTGSISLVGGFNLSGPAELMPTPVTVQFPVPDPYTGVSPPSFSNACDFVNVVINDVSSPLSPGVYCNGIQIGGHAVVTLNAGIYILQGGGFTVRGNSTVTGSEVMLFDTGSADTYQPIVVGHNSTVQLSAATSGQFRGILFFADRNISSPQASSSQTANVLGAGPGSTFKGALYFPTQTVSLENFAPGACAQVIADQIQFAGDTQVSCR